MRGTATVAGHPVLASCTRLPMAQDPVPLRLRSQLVPPVLSLVTVIVVTLLHPRVADGVARPLSLAVWVLPSLAGGLLATLLSLVAPGIARESTLVNMPPETKTRWQALPPAARATVDRAVARILVGIAGVLWLLGVLFQLVAWSHAHGGTASSMIPWPIFALPVVPMIVGFGMNAVEEAIRRAELTLRSEALRREGGDARVSAA